MEITPTPTDEEAAAIMAAWSVLWPAPTAASQPVAAQSTAWRFADRWWHASDRFGR